MDSNLTRLGFDLRLGFEMARLGLRLALIRLLICAVKSQVILWVLSAPASSSPKRVFSQGGLIIKPNRSSMSNDELSNLIFLKCNINKGWHVYC